MSDSLRLETRSSGAGDAPGRVQLAALDALLDAAAQADGQPAFNDQTRLETRAGTNRVVLGFDGERLVAAAAVADDTLELVVTPDARGRGLGEQLALAVPSSLAWAHGDHPAARRLAQKLGFDPVRRLLQLRRPLDPSTVAAASGASPGVTIDTFRPGLDDGEWVELNARVFAGHPEQGRLTASDLHARMGEPWFEAGDFLVARDSATGSMIGYNWLKVEPPEPDGSRIGEIYVIGVDARSSGRGLGRTLMQHGLTRLQGRGCTTAALYVEEDNGPAVPLYRSLGFTDHTVDVQYARR
ncbi:mycothiol synthase [Subtercola boreus]|uniref:Mycothiol acetyltransferase n=1 Tax=Subtercola boreus TaxID=120213 RepID=A0A3E0W9F6_9MICO|nr:mycothiol synthase [Subtercola boreus]RFA19341.1 mycothiol synthase [Subtercola boreus]RFA19602.1 mycothiol synthase [Subtercola boreus]RFA25967.1 mycothiol synthase [Subtercola boreus]